MIEESERERIDAEAIARVDAAVEFADASPFPAPESLYDDVYVLDGGGSRLLLGAAPRPRPAPSDSPPGEQRGRDPPADHHGPAGRRGRQRG